MTIARTIDPRIPQYLVPITPTSLSILYSQCEQLPKPRIGKYDFSPVLSQGCLCGEIRLLTNLQGEAQCGEGKVTLEEVSYEREERRRRVNRRQEKPCRGRVR